MTNRLSAFITIAILILLVAFSDLWPSQTVRVWIFDVGQGDAIFIDGPNTQVLIDGGPDALVLERLSGVMPWWDRSIDVVVNTHPHADHTLGLLPVLERYKVGAILDADEGYATPEFDEYLRLAAAEGKGRQIISAGDVIDLGGGATLTTLWPLEPYNRALLDDPNDGSIIMLFEYGESNMLLMGDAGVEEEAAILGALPDKIEVLKVGHHGSDTSTSRGLLEVINPEVAVISCGLDNDYGHPSPFVVDRLESSGAEVYRTDLEGNLRLKFGRNNYQISPVNF